MNAIERLKPSARLLAPAALCLGLAAIPALASACDMQAINDDLVRMSKAEQLAPQVQAAADPSGSAAADPSGSAASDPSGSAQQGSGNTASSANQSGSGSAANSGSGQSHK